MSPHCLTSRNNGIHLLRWDAYPYPFVLVDAERRVLYSNAAARELAELRDGLGIEDGRIVLDSAKQARVFQQAVIEIARPPRRALQDIWSRGRVLTRSPGQATPRLKLCEPT